MTSGCASVVVTTPLWFAPETVLSLATGPAATVAFRTVETAVAPETVMVTLPAFVGKVYVDDALPLLSVVTLGVPKFPPTPPSLKL